MTLRLRKAEAEDAAVIAAIQLAGYRWAYGPLLPEAFFLQFDHAERSAEWRQRILAGEFTGEKQLLVCENASGGIAGYVSSGPARYPDRMGTGELQNLYVDQNQSRAGAGKALFYAAYDFLKSRGHDGFYVMCMRGNETGHAFYRKMGGTLNPRDFITRFNGFDVDDKSLYWRF